MEEPPTRFELLTAAALAWFADEAVDVAVIEVGLGGRWDSTNVVDGDVAVLTNISFDHTEVLGPTLEDIGARQVGHLQGGQPGGHRRVRPHAGRPAPARRPGEPGPPRCGCGGRTSPARPTGSPSADG